MEIKGNKIKLIETIPSDIDRIMKFEVQNSGFVHQYTKRKHLNLLDDKDCLHLSIRRLDNDGLIGHVIVFGVCNKHKVLEFRRITINETGVGYGREALKLLKELCFEKFKAHRLWLDVYDDNDKAIYLYESEGFVQEGKLRENIKTANGYRSQRIYSMLEDEYKLN